MSKALRNIPALALAAAACLLLLAVPRAHAARGMEVALEDDPVFVSQYYYDRERALQQAQALGVSRIRVNLSWASSMGGQQNLPLPPLSPKWNFNQVDGLVDAAERYDHRVRGCKGPRTLRADGYAHHPYEFKHAPNYRYPGSDNATMGSIKNLTHALDRLKKARVLKPNRGSHMPLYFTEYGYFASGKRKIADSKRARWLPQAFAMALKMPRVKEMLQYLLVQPPSKLSAGAYFDLSIVSSSGHPLSPFNALLAWSQQVAAAHQILVPGGPIGLPPAPAGSAPAPRH